MPIPSGDEHGRLPGTPLARKVAVVTGASGGLGLALARRYARAGTDVVPAARSQPGLDAAVEQVRATGARAIGVLTDVSKEQDVQALCGATLDEFGRVDLVCNNAGVMAMGRLWESSNADWNWVLGGSKHAVLSVAETLQQDLRQIGSSVDVSMVLPGAIRSNMATAAQRRPAEYGESRVSLAEEQFAVEWLTQFGTDPDVLAERIDTAMAAGKFYIFTHPADARRVPARSEDMVAGFLTPPSDSIYAESPAPTGEDSTP